METGSDKFKHLIVNQLGLRHAISQAVALNAPAGTIVLYVAGTASIITSTFITHPFGSYAIPLILLLSLVVYALMSYSMYEFSRKLSSAGGYYTFVSRGLGNSAGFVTALSYITYEILSFTGFGILGFLGFAYAIFPSLGIAIPDPEFLWMPVAFVFIGLVSLLIYLGIKPSLRFVSYTVFIEVAFLIFTSVALIVMHHTSVNLEPFTPTPMGNDPYAIFAMMIYAIGAFVGIGGSIPIAEETKKPKRNVPLAILVTIAVLGITIILASYAQVVSWGLNRIDLFGSSSDPYPLLTIYHSAFGPLSIILFWAIIIIVLNSFFTATVSLGTNATRVIFSMAREGALPSFLSEMNRNNGTPTMAMIVLTAISIAIVIGVGAGFEFFGHFSPVNALLTSSVFLLILESPITYIVHILTNTSLYSYMKKRTKMKAKDLFKYLVIPSVSTVTLIAAIVAGIYFNLFLVDAIYASFALIAIIIISTLVMRAKFKEKLEYLGDFSL
ncbi:amino acid transporter [Thermoplasma volcanium GSS1]|uniref:Amino acid transporter n=1 Tax=Thermoplasma volcanium (strain ATCC 51530 / DSM 4299 / JCM 9571 / NBRC 15438 / GSS1) TaxID=273116 RepID=Q97A43_THEVO|nr:APC family permease [Thermoplasma volcanium]BAB60109.1 amino acid transporter [Thermoplasma volcanium GSS1]